MRLPFGSQPEAFPVGDFTDLMGLADAVVPGQADRDLKLSGAMKLREGSREGLLQVHASIASDWHVYALSQKGGPGPSTITVRSSDQIELLGPFQPDEVPEVREVAEFDVPLEEHYGQVTWTAPIRLAEGVDPQTVELEVLFSGILCHDEQGCMPLMDAQVAVRFEGFLGATEADAVIPKAGEYRADRSHVTIRGYVQPAVVQPGGVLSLVLTAVCDESWYIYAYAEQDPDEVAKPTLIVLTEPSEWTMGEVRVSSEPIVKEEPGQVPVAYHGGTVSWTVDLQVPAAAEPGTVRLAGLIGYQTCTDVSCDRPLAAEFRVAVEIASQRGEGQVPLEFTAASYGNVARAATARSRNAAVDEAAVAESDPRLESDADRVSRPPIDFWAVTFDQLGFRETPDGWTHRWFPTMMFSAGTLWLAAVGMALAVSFLAGLILNVMPCVLPVIGLKLMSFAQQAEEHRWRIFSLNVWFALGMWLMFLVFATAAAALHLVGETLAWGAHLGNPYITVPLLLVVFTLGLSMFGVWEIPIPGFAGGSKASELAQREGPSGAFLKGVLMTVLATPCAGPFIGVAVGIAVIAPIWLNYSMFTSMALGMASPYLVIGAFPRLIKWLPKPGQWMNTMKEFMGFVLMGTGVYIISFMENRMVFPVLSLLVGVAAACWVIGGIPITARLAKRARNWGWGLLFGLVGFWLFVTLLPPSGEMAAVQPAVSDSSPELPWEAHTPERLQQYRDEGRTVLVQFTAAWCAVCKINEVVALNTFDTKELVLANGVAALKADKTHWRSPQTEAADQLLVELGNYGKTVPFLAIYPAGGAEPILLGGAVTKDQVLSALNRAGPSRGVVEDTEA